MSSSDPASAPDPASSGDSGADHDPSSSDPSGTPVPPSPAVPPPGYPTQGQPIGQGGYGAVPPAPVAACQYCGNALAPNAAVCGACQAPVMVFAGQATSTKDKTAAGLLGIFLGGFGVHKFYLGYNTAGAIMLGVTLGGFCLIFAFIGILFFWVPSVIGFVEGIIYLTKSDAEFQQTYVLNKKEWF